MSPLGPVFRNSTAMTANGTIRPLQDNAWIYRVLPFAAIIWMSIEATTTAVVYTFSAGSDIQAGPDEPVQGGATAGIFQQDNNFFDQFLGSPGDELQLIIRETGGATPTVNTVVRLQPI